MKIEDLKDIKSLVEFAFPIKNPIKFGREYDGEGIFDPAKLTFYLNDNTYFFANEYISFIYKGSLYVMPFLNQAIDILEKAGFKHRFMYVPFSQGEYPLENVEKWNEIKKIANEEYWRLFHIACRDMSEQMHIKTISPVLLRKYCMEIPLTGIRVANDGTEITYYPYFKHPVVDPYVTMLLGKYLSNNGTCVFVHADGRTYITQSYKVVQELENSGYTPKRFTVPLADKDEKIVDSELAERWEKVKMECNY